MAAGFMFSLVLALLAVVSVFMYIPFASEWAFWLVIVAYIVLAGTRFR
jgi:hypothetical protein